MLICSICGERWDESELETSLTVNKSLAKEYGEAYLASIMEALEELQRYSGKERVDLMLLDCRAQHLATLKVFERRGCELLGVRHRSI